MSFQMPWVRRISGKHLYVNAADETQCVEFVRQAASAPHTSTWRPGVRVMDARPGSIAAGTAIATFVDGGYPTDNKGKHAAIYISHDQTGISVLDQWKDQGEVKARTIKFRVPPGTRRSNDGSCFYVIETGAPPEQTKEEVHHFQHLEQARNAAIAWLEQRGVVFGPQRAIVPGRLGTFAGSEVGVSSPPHWRPFWRLRIDYDPKKEAHYNAEFGEGTARVKAAFCFPATAKELASLVRHRAPR
jgi:hypothetical protein